MKKINICLGLLSPGLLSCLHRELMPSHSALALKIGLCVYINNKILPCTLHVQGMYRELMPSHSALALKIGLCVCRCVHYF